MTMNLIGHAHTANLLKRCNSSHRHNQPKESQQQQAFPGRPAQAPSKPVPNLKNERLPDLNATARTHGRELDRLGFSLLHRLAQSQAFWCAQRPVCDYFILTEAGYQHHQSVPRTQLAGGALFRFEHLVTLTFEVGRGRCHPFYTGEPIDQAADEPTRAHPVIRYFHKGRCMDTLHLQDLLQADAAVQSRMTTLFQFLDRHLRTFFSVTVVDAAPTKTP